jgi:tetratricopeptide (TPR) repeat protein
VIGDGTIQRWDPATGALEALRRPRDPAARITTLAPDGRTLAVGTRQGQVRLLHAATLQESRPPLTTGKPFVLDLAFSADGLSLAVHAAPGENDFSTFQGEGAVWNLATGQPTGPPVRSAGLLGGLTCQALAPDGQTLAEGQAHLGRQGIESVVRLHRTAGLQPLGDPLPVAANQGVTGLFFSPDGRWLLGLSRVFPNGGGEAVVWDVTTRQRKGTPLATSAPPTQAAFAPDGAQMAVAAGRQVFLWDLAGQRVTATLDHAEEVTRLRYQRGGRELQTVAKRQVALWDPATGEPLRPPLEHPASVLDAALTPDGRSLVVTTSDRTAYVWALLPDAGEPADWERLARLLSVQTVDGTAARSVGLDQLTADWQDLHARRPQWLTPSAEQIQQWHESRAGAAIDQERWPVAVAHLRRLAQGQPANAWLRYLACICAAATGDRATIREQGEALRALAVANPGNLYPIDWAVKSCLLLPDALPDPGPILKAAEYLDHADPQGFDFHWFALSRGLAHYRAGRWAAAAERLERCLAAKNRTPLCGALAQEFLAMTRQHQGRDGEAKKLLNEARRLLAEADKVPQGASWIERIHVRAALAEAEKVVGPAPAEKP